MIVTCKKHIPLKWIVLTVLPWASFTFNFNVVGAAFVFSLKKFVENPAGLTFVLSLPGFIAIILAPMAGFMSDRIWTRWGRRKPFVVTAATMMVVALTLMPLMPNIWGLIGAYVLYHLSDALASPRDPLKQEVVPPHERGRATGIMSWCQNLATLIFYAAILGRFDDVVYFGGLEIQGEQVVYWSAAMGLFAMVLLIAWGIKEVNQHSPLRGQRLTVQNFVGGLLDRELWPVYLLVFGYCLLNFYSGFGPFLSTLLYTDQWGYTKQEMGLNVAIGGVANIFIIGFLTLLADRLPRMKSFRVLMYLSLTWNAFYFCYVNFLLPDRRPSLLEIILFGEVLSIISTLIGLVYFPLIFDYVRRNKMGTFSAGMQIATRATTLFTMNGVGLFVWAWATLFQPPAGETVRVTLQSPASEATLLTELRAAEWKDPVTGASLPTKALHAEPWQADGVHPRESRGWEIRLSNADSAQQADRAKELDTRRFRLLAQQKMRGNDRSAEASPDKDATGEVATLEAEAAAIRKDMTARADNFRTQLEAQLAHRLSGSGSQVRSVSSRPSRLIELSTEKQPTRDQCEELARALRGSGLEVIDVRPLKRDENYGLTVSVFASTESEQQVERVRAEIAGRGHDVRVLSVENATSIDVEFSVIEEPVPSFVSPVDRVGAVVGGWFGYHARPARRLDAMARNLRVAEETNHVWVRPGAGVRTIAVATVFGPEAKLSEKDALTSRLHELLPEAGETTLGQLRAFHDRVETAATAQRLTLARPILAAHYAPMRYDYMSGYLWVFFVGAIGITLTYIFGRMEKRGSIRKRGVEEATES